MTVLNSDTGPLHTRICELFGVKYPIVQTGMGYVSDARLTAATTKAGGLGIIAGAMLTYGRTRQRHRLRQRPHGPTIRRESASQPGRHRSQNQTSHSIRSQDRLLRARAESSADRPTQRCRPCCRAVDRSSQTCRESCGMGS